PMTTFDPAMAEPIPAPATRAVLVEASSGGKPTTVALLSDWEYLERALQRLIAGWGRYIAEWEDKVVVHRQIWEQAECVRRLREYRRRYPHATSPAYRAAIERELAACEQLLRPLTVEGTPAAPAGVNTSFRLPARPAYPAGSRPEHDFMPFVSVDFTTSVETRRLFWCYGYMRQMNP